MGENILSLTRRGNNVGEYLHTLVRERWESGVVSAPSGEGEVAEWESIPGISQGQGMLYMWVVAGKMLLFLAKERGG